MGFVSPSSVRNSERPGSFRLIFAVLDYGRRPRSDTATTPPRRRRRDDAAATTPPPRRCRRRDAAGRRHGGESALQALVEQKGTWGGGVAESVVDNEVEPEELLGHLLIGARPARGPRRIFDGVREPDGPRGY